MNEPCRSILIIDDNPEDRGFIRQLLLTGSERRFRFAEAETGAAGISLYGKAADAPYDCILLDYHLPDFDALEFLAMLSGPSSLVSPVVVITGSSDNIDAAAVLRLGVQELINKNSINVGSLTRCIENAVERFRMTCELREKERMLSESQRIAHVGSWVCGFDGRMSWSDESYCLHGVSPDTFTPQAESVVNLIHAADRPALRAWFASYRDGKNPGEIVIRRVLPGGDPQYLCMRGELQRDAEGRGIRMAGTVQDITEQKRAEKALLEAETYRLASNYTRTLIETSLDPLIVISLQGSITDANAAAEAVTGYSRDELVGTEFANCFVNAMNAESVYRQVLQTESVRDYPLEILNRNGRLTPILCSASRFHDLEGKVAGVFISAHDISEIKKSEKALRDSEDKFSKIFHSSPVGMAILRAADRIFIDANNNFLRIYGYSANEIIGHSSIELGLWQNVKYCDDLVNNIIEFGEPHQAEFEYKHKHWKISRTLLLSFDIVEISNEICLLGTTMDITDNMLMARELRKSRASLEFCLQNSGIGAWEMDLDSHLTHRTLLHDRIYGYEALLPEWTYERFLEHVLPEDRERVDEIFRNAVATQSGWSFELRIRRADGEVRWLYCAGGHFQNVGVDPEYVSGIVQDITERKRITEELAVAKESAEAANRAKSDFLANMSHEIRTPLNAILGMARMLKDSAYEANQRERIAKLEMAGQHLLALIEGILDLSKIDAGKLQLHNVDFSPGMLCDQVKSLIRERAAEKGLRLLFDIGCLPPVLNGDLLRLRQALLNYLSNAVKFTEQGDIELNACIAEETATDLLVKFTVSDTGVGIAPQVLERLFDAFEQADAGTTRNYGGTGLGLTITRKLAQLMGGEAGAESGLGRGSTFWFTARLGKRPGPTVPAEPLPSFYESESVKPGDFRGIRILLAEDNRLNQEVALYMLRAAGFVVDLAENGRLAVQMAGMTPYALILMDMQMPEMDGLEASRAIRRLPWHRGTPILAMTANALSSARLDCLDAGMNDYLTKPVERSLLINKLAHWLPQAADDPVSGHAAQPPDHPPAVDISAGLQFWRTPENYRKKLGEFVAEYAPHADVIADCIQSGNLQEAAKKAHELNGIVGFLGLVELAPIAMSLDRALAAKDPPAEDFDGLLVSLRQSLANSLVEISAYVKDSGQSHEGNA